MSETLRCSVCGKTTTPDPLMTGFDPRYRTGHCSFCHATRQLVLAATIEEATRGYHQLVETRRHNLAERKHLEHQEK